MGVNTGMSQALLGNNPLATIQGVCVRNGVTEMGLFQESERKKDRKLSSSTTDEQDTI